MTTRSRRREKEADEDGEDEVVMGEEEQEEETVNIGNKRRRPSAGTTGPTTNGRAGKRSRQIVKEDEEEEENEAEEDEEPVASGRRRSSRSVAAVSNSTRRRREYSTQSNADDEEFEEDGEAEDEDEDAEPIEVEDEESQRQRATASSMDDLELEITSSQSSQTSRAPSNPEDEKYQVGIIEKMQLINFMCHRNLTVTFGPNVNFIVGRNGSGKSAILVALTIALGARTGFSGRGHKFADLIYKKASSAKIIIQLRNRGSEAYKPELFGKSIIIERQLTRDEKQDANGKGRTAGKSVYLLKNGKGQVVLRKKVKSEIDLILEHFNIHIDNPCEILMQDTSRKFLAQDSPKDKYKFFQAATLLSKLEAEYTAVSDALKTLKLTLNEKRKAIPEFEHRVEELKKEYEVLLKIKKIGEESKKQKIILLWAFVRDQEEVVRKLEGEIKSKKGNLAKLKEKETSIGEALEVKKREQSDVVALLAELNRKLRQHNEDGRAFVQATREAERALLEAQKAHGRVTSEIKLMRSRLKAVEDYSQEIRQRMSHNRKEEQEKRQQEIDSRTAELNELRTNCSPLKHKEAEKSAEHESLGSEIRDLNAEIARLENERRKTLQSIDSLKRTKNNSTAAFGRDVPQILQLIERHARSFHQKPIGPIGMYVSVGDKRWAATIETKLRRNLKNFICHDSHDSNLLSKLVKDNRLGDVVTITQAFENSVYRDLDEPPRDLLTIYRCLSFQHPMVANVLIDQEKIESWVLESVENIGRARELAYRQRYAVLLSDGREMYLKGTSQVNKAAPGNVQNVMLGANVDDLIAQEEQKEQDLRHVIADRRAEVKGREDMKRAIEREIGSLRSTIRKIETSINSLQKEIHDLSQVEPEPDNEADLAETQKSIEDYRAKIEEATVQLLQLEGNVEEATARVKQAKAEKQRHDASLQELNDENEKLESKNQKLSDAINRAEAALEAAAAQSEKVSAELQEKEEQLRKETEQCKTMNEQAQQRTHGQRIDDDRPVEDIKAIIRGLDEQLKKSAEQHRPIAEVKRDFTEAKTNLERFKGLITRLDKRAELLEHKLESRLGKKTQFIRSISKQTTLFFNAFLSQTNAAGVLEFDHNEKTLSIQVQVTGNAAKKQLSSTQQLSGGERSSSTVALLLAMWSNIESPFRAMDEFDVFMDSGRRKVTMELLIDYAKQHPRRQFIYISPQDQTILKQFGNSVRVFNMPDPEISLSQGTLNFGTQFEE